MVRDKTQGGEDKRIENSVNICGATPFVSQNHVLTFTCDLGQAVNDFVYLTNQSVLFLLASSFLQDCANGSPFPLILLFPHLLTAAPSQRRQPVSGR